MMKSLFSPRRSCPAMICGLALAGALAALPAPAAELQPHRALYSASLRDPSPSGPITGISGTLVISLERSCDGWLMGQQMLLDISAGGRGIHQDARFTSWESLDGHNLRFAKREKTGSQDNGLKGAAAVTGTGGGGNIRYQFPKDEVVSLPPGTLFPIGHMRSLIASAEAGEQVNTQIVFDGTTPDGAQRISTFIGPRREMGKGVAQTFGPLIARPAWPMRLAIFPLGSRTAEPAYEAEVLQLDNGVVGAMGLDMAGVKMDLKLEKLEALPDPKCPKN